MSHAPRTTRGHRERNGERRENRAPGDRFSEDDRRPQSDRLSRPPDDPEEDAPEPEPPEPPEPRPARDAPWERCKESSCWHLCSRRGILLICSVLTNALVLICVVAAQMSMSGLTARGGLGGFNISSNLNLQGTELQQVRDLDMLLSQMRAPGVYSGLAFSLVMGVGSLLFAVLEIKVPHRLSGRIMSGKILHGALVFQAVGAVAFVVAVGLYLHFVIAINATPLCQRRERLYARNGYTWMNCSVGGADAAVALFGLITAILYACGAVLTFRTIRTIRTIRSIWTLWTLWTKSIVLICSVLTNALVLICVVAAQMSMSGLTARGGLGGFNISSNLNLQGTELQQVHDLDMQFSQMRAPGVYGSLAFSLVMGVGSLLFAVLEMKAPHRLSHWILLVFQAAGAMAYVVAVGLYLHFVIAINATELCQRRERLYAHNGYTWMNCSVGGADAAMALFGLITAILYAYGAVLTFWIIRIIRIIRIIGTVWIDRGIFMYVLKADSGEASPVRADTTMV